MVDLHLWDRALAAALPNAVSGLPLLDMLTLTVSDACRPGRAVFEKQALPSAIAAPSAWERPLANGHALPAHRPRVGRQPREERTPICVMVARPCDHPMLRSEVPPPRLPIWTAGYVGPHRFMQSISRASRVNRRAFAPESLSLTRDVVSLVVPPEPVRHAPLREEVLWWC